MFWPDELVTTRLRTGVICFSKTSLRPKSPNLQSPEESSRNELGEEAKSQEPRCLSPIRWIVSGETKALREEQLSKMTEDSLRPFASLESALEFMVLLENVLAENTEKLEQMRKEAGSKRYGSGVQLALYKVSQLSSHVSKSRRLLNDLALIRAVLVGEQVPHLHALQSMVQQPNARVQ